MARPTKLTAAVEKVILDALRIGATRTAAFEAAGVARSKISVWLARYGTFRDAVMQAEAQAELRATVTIRQAYDAGDWKASLAWLERRRAEDWSRRDRLEIEIRRTAERVAAQTGADPDWLVKRAAEIVAGETGAER
jgi:hypothetical protein